MRELFRKEIEMANRGISFARVCNRARCHDAWRTWVHVDSSQSNNKKTEEETQKKKKKKQKKNIILDSIDVSRSWKLLFICSVVVGFFFSLFFTLLVLSSSSVAFPFSYMLFFFFILVVSYSSVGSGRMTVVCKVQREGITIESNSYERNVFACVHSVTECILPFSCVLCVWYVCTNISIYCALYLIAIANGRPIFDLSNGADAFYTNTTHVYINVSI